MAMNGAWVKRFRRIKRGLLGGCTALVILISMVMGAAQAQQPTLPPTWTPLPTFTPIPTATLTLTPTVTLTVTPAPTLSAESICETFTITGAPRDELSIPYAGGGGFSWQGIPYDSLVLLTLKRADNGEEVIIPFAADEGFNALFSAKQLPAWGRYTWTLSVYLEAYGEICPHSGAFYREAWWTRPIENPLAPPFVP